MKIKLIDFKNLKIRTKIALAVATLIASVALFIYLYFPYKLEQIAFQKLTDSFKITSSITAFSISPSLFFNDVVSSKESIEAAKLNSSLVYIVVKDNDGRTFCTYNEKLAVQSFYLEEKEIYSADKKYYKIVTPIVHNNEIIGKLYLGFSLENFQNSIRESKINISLLSLFIFIGGIFIVILIASFITEPLKNLVKVVRQIAQGDFTKRAIINSSDELGELANNFNTMVDNLHFAYSELEQSNRLLEDRVSDRTKLLQREVDEHKNTVAKLNISEAKSTALLNAIPDLMLVFDKTGNILEYKMEREEELFLNKEESIIGKNIFEVMPESVSLSTIDYITKTILTGMPSDLEYRLEFDGKVKYYESRFVLKGFDEVLTIVRDITERKHNEEELRKLYSAVEQSTTSIMITDLKGNIEYINPKFTSLTGYSLDEVQGKNPRLLSSGNKSVAEYKHLWKTILSGKEWHGEFFNKKKNGEFFWERTSISSIKNSKGVITNFLAFQQDITEQKLIEEKLIQSERDYRGLFENSHDSILILDPENKKFIDVNSQACSLFNISNVEFKNIPFDDFALMLDKNIANIKIDRDVESLKNIQTTYYKTDGTKHYLELNTASVFYRGIKAILLIFSDITERIKFEQELVDAKEKAEKSDRLKSEFLAQMSHEIRTPINIILSFNSLLKEQLEDKVDEDLKSSFGIIDNGGRRLIRTIDLILNMSQVQTESYDINIIEIDIINDIFEKILFEYKAIAKEKNIQLNILKNTDATKVKGDYFTIIQIFSNLIDNAIKFTNKGSVEIILYCNSSDEFCVDIKDTGIGISEEFLPQLFTPFSQEETGYTRTYEGNGLGLALAKKYAELNNIKILVESEKEVGSTFTVNFSQKLN